MPMLEALVEEVLGEEGNEEFIYMLIGDNELIKQVRGCWERFEIEKSSSSEERGITVEQIKGELTLLIEQRRGTCMGENERTEMTIFLNLAETLYNQLKDKAWKDINELAAQMTATANIEKYLEKDRWDSAFWFPNIDDGNDVGILQSWGPKYFPQCPIQ